VTRVFPWQEKLGCTGSDWGAGRRQRPEQVGDREGSCLHGHRAGSSGQLVVIAAEKGGGQESAVRCWGLVAL